MTTVFSGGAEWLTAREGLGWPTLPVCAQLKEHWQQNPATRRADKRITGFTADASSLNFETCGKFDFWETVYMWYLALVDEQPRDSSQLAGGSHLFCDVPLVHSFRGEKIHHMLLLGVNISSCGQNGAARMGIALEVVQIYGAV
jgi:hypothetical protein